MPQPGKYGRRRPDPGKPRLWLDDYFTPAHVASALPPFSQTAADVVPSWPMYMNGPDPAMPPGVPAEGIGCCTWSYAGHAIQAVTAKAGQEVTVANSSLLTGYCAVGGYVIGDEGTDQGCQIQDVLGYMRTTGLAVPGGGTQKIAAFGALRSWDPATLNAVLQLFWTVDLGINCPDSAQQQFGAGQPWTVVPGSQDDGGHCVGLQGFQPGADEMEPVTWGALWSMTAQFAAAFIEEAWVPVFPQVLAAAKASGALNLSALAADFAAMTGETFPLS